MGKSILKECVYVCNWVTSLYSRDWHDIVNQLVFQKKKIMWLTEFSKYSCCAGPWPDVLSSTALPVFWTSVEGGLYSRPAVLQHFGHMMRRTDSLEKPLMLGKIEGEGDDRGWDGWVVSPTWWTWVWLNCRSWWWTGKPGVLQSMGSQRVGHNWATELNWVVLQVRS